MKFILVYSYKVTSVYLESEPLAVDPDLSPLRCSHVGKRVPAVQREGEEAAQRPGGRDVPTPPAGTPEPGAQDQPGPADPQGPPAAGGLGVTHLKQRGCVENVLSGLSCVLFKY